MKKLFMITMLSLIGLGCLEAQKSRTQVKISTPYGDIIVELYNETPQHRDNFIKLVKDGFYDGLLFHRCIKAFMIQGGDPDSKNAKLGQALGTGDLGYTIPAEINPKLIHRKGALCAARMPDQVNPKRESSGCQFYIVQGQVYTPEQLSQFEARKKTKLSPEQIQIYTTEGGTPHLDMEYTVFGQVVKGLEIIQTISELRTDQNDRPINDVPMTVTILK